ncbi:hypothetical protein BRADI_3g13675v3, partial [Brachypodium distachyon]
EADRAIDLLPQHHPSDRIRRTSPPSSLPPRFPLCLLRAGGFLGARRFRSAGRGAPLRLSRSWTREVRVAGSTELRRQRLPLSPWRRRRVHRLYHAFKRGQSRQICSFNSSMK